MLFIFDENFPKEFVKGFSILEKANKRSNISVEVVFSVDFMGGPKFDPTTGESKIGIDDRDIVIKASQQQAVLLLTMETLKGLKTISHY